MSEAGLARRFSRGAQQYNQSAELQREVAGALADWLPPTDGPILELGCGSGFLTRLLPGPDLQAIDLSEEMVRLCQEENPQAICTRADLRNWTPPAAVDLVVSSSTLHWIRPFQVAANQLALFGRQFAFALMLDGTLSGIRRARQEIAPKKQHPPFPKASEVAQALKTAGCCQLEMEIRHFDQTFSDGSALLHELHNFGLTAGGAQLLTRSELHALIHQLSTPTTAEWTVGFFRGRFACKKM